MSVAATAFSTVSAPRTAAGRERPLRLVALASTAALFVLATLLASRRHATFDYGITHAMNAYAMRWPLLDLMVNESTKVLFSTSLLVAAVWYVWFSANDVQQRASVMVATVVSLAAGGFSRALQRILPTHPRPLHDAAFGFTVPFSVAPGQLSEWNSYPSDHVVVFFGLAATVSLVNRKLGYACYALAAILSIVRVYLGFHWPTDCLGGAALGILFVELTRPLARTAFVQRIVPGHGRSGPLFYAIAFYFSIGMAQLFDDPRTLASDLHGFFHHLLR